MLRGKVRAGGIPELLFDARLRFSSDWFARGMALGANAVAIGKLHGWGLGAGAAEGLVRVLELRRTSL